jgi:LysM repeat protein
MAIQEQLGKMIGPLPVGAWIAVVGGGLAFALYQRNKGNVDLTAPGELDNTSVDSGVGLGGVPAGYTYTGGDAGDDPTGSQPITDNITWATNAVNALVASGYDAAAAQTAISNYINGGTLTLQQWAMISLAIARVGAVPDPPTTQNNPPATKPPGSTVTPPKATPVFKPIASRTPTGIYYVKSAVRGRDKTGKIVGPSRSVGYRVTVTQWGTINSVLYARSYNYYYPESTLTSHKPASGQSKSGGTKKVTGTKKKTTPAKPKPKPKLRTYTVKRGDTLSGIAQHYHMSWQRLYNANRGKISNPNRIYPGQKLTIPN